MLRLLLRMVQYLATEPPGKSSPDAVQPRRVFRCAFRLTPSRASPILFTRPRHVLGRPEVFTVEENAILHRPRTRRTAAAANGRNAP